MQTQPYTCMDVYFMDSVFYRTVSSKENVYDLTYLQRNKGMQAQEYM